VGDRSVVLRDNWSVKDQYLALGTDGSNVTSGPSLVTGSPAPRIFNWRHDIPVVQTAKIGLNYKFGGPVVEEQRTQPSSRKSRSSH
jgi:hypothetical protein